MAAIVPATPGARWFACAHCGAPVPVVAPTDPPPLFSWEVYPQVYPPLAPVAVPGRGAGRLATVALVASVLLLVGVGGALVGSGVEALGPATFGLAGFVVSGVTNGGLPTATLVLVGENGWSATTGSSSDGSFGFHGIPGGGATLNVSAPGFAPETFELFFSPTFRGTDGGPRGLVVTLDPGAATNATLGYVSPFTDLEGFVSSVWSAAALLVIAAVVAGVGALWAYRGRHPAYAIAGGAAASLAPAALALLSVPAAFPLVDVPAVALVGLGLVAIALEIVPLYWEVRPADPGA